ncbi:HAD family hydrolase [Saccharopolyspora sp. 5N102]|uniref:HAD family hydrolase n=1 Tax=Saccharopolyspora sp. 5N102 TaxID=3375155 RepID=UPI0037962DF0
MAEGLVIWDFDGTLGQRTGSWTGCALEVLDQHRPGHIWTRSDVAPLLSSGFPWHTPEVPHPELSEPGQWWARLEVVFSYAFAALGISEVTACELAREVRPTYLSAATWSLSEHAVAVLERLRSAGWTQVLLSNHVPELPEILARLGCAHYFTEVLTSATLGYEKPHPAAFQAATAMLPNVETWMVGDNPAADIAGARECGLNAILVGADGSGRRLSLPAAAGRILSRG